MTEEKIAELLKIHELNHHKAQILIQQKAKLRVLETLCVATHITNPLYKKEEEMIATCIEDNDNKSHVLHEVRQTLDGLSYSITLSAEAPDLALKIAREIPLTYWKEEV